MKNVLGRHLGFSGSAAALATFRILFAAALLLEIVRLIDFHGFFFGPALAANVNAGSGLQALAARFVVEEVGITRPLLFVQALAVLLILIGYKTRWAAIINYACMVPIFGLYGPLSQFTYAADGLYFPASLFLLFAPASRVASVDAWLARRKGMPHGRSVSPIYPAFLATVMGLFYADAVGRKSLDLMWRRGLGIWSWASLPPFVYWDLSFGLDQELLVKAMSYSVMLFQIIFLPLLWFRRLRVPLLLFGIVMHVGIAVTFPIPLFSLISIAFLMGLMPDTFFVSAGRILGRAMASATSPVTESPQAQASLEAGARIALVAIVIWFVLCAWIHPWAFAKSERRALFMFTGILPRGLYLAGTVESYRGEYKLSFVDRAGTTIELPLIDHRGIDRQYLTDRVYCVWLFYRALPTLTPAEIREDVNRMASVWARKTGHDLSQGVIRVEYRPQRVQIQQWEPGLFRENRAVPWQTVDEVKISPQ